MSFNESNPLKKYADVANQRFIDVENRINQIEHTLDIRMNGKSQAGIAGSMVGTVCWVAAICIFFGCIRGYINETFHTICLVISLVMMALLFINEAISYSYYGKISNYRNDINQLKNRINKGKSSITADQESFMKSSFHDWNCPLSVGTSIPEEIIFIEESVSSTESLKDGFIHDLKNYCFFVFAVAFTIAGSWALFDVVGDIMRDTMIEFGEDPFSHDTIITLCTIGLVITVIGEIFLAKLVWSKTDCSVTNVTLLIAAAGPVMFLALMTVGSLIVLLAIGLFRALLYVLVFIAAFGCLTASSGG